MKSGDRREQSHAAPPLAGHGTALTMFLSSAAAVVVVLGPTCWMSVCSVRQYRLFLFQDIPKSLCNGSGKVFNTSRSDLQYGCVERLQMLASDSQMPKHLAPKFDPAPQVTNRVYHAAV
ncbi:hypothetical protein F2P81_000894 [Scophthalmus maximus]|uniref:Uncharacterized protein n=1 Tax=Scophthalmus maximus TaxID=52904 RepID=A0A6A4TXP6_SCOMX|nr:hypothetical protein F2P81_000894 [Scophthalmus maximus]